MEQGSLQKFLTHGKGLCNVPSDATCDDDQLEVCTNMMIRDGELVPIQHNAELFGLGDDEAKTPVVNGELMFVHELNTGEKNYIYYNDSQLYYYYKDDAGEYKGEIGSALTGVTHVKSIGNTLIVNYSDGLYYFLWKSSDNSYLDLGNKIPEIQISFAKEESEVDVTASEVPFSWDSDGYWVQTDKDTADELLVGLYSKVKNKAYEKKQFVDPLFVRAALELYDGTYIHASCPYLIPVSTGRNVCFSIEDSYIRFYASSFSIKVRQETDYTNFSDLVKNVTIFATSGTNLTKTELLPSLYYPCPVKNVEGALYPQIVLTELLTRYGYYENTINAESKETISQTKYVKMPVRDTVDIINDLISHSSIFYKFCELGIKKILGSGEGILRFVDTAKYVKENTISNLATQEALSDSYYSLCPMIPKSMDTYNRRLNIINVERGFFDGFAEFVNYGYESKFETKTGHEYNLVVYIRTNSGDRIVTKTITSSLFIPSFWFYYPDTRAYKLEIYDSGGKIGEYELKEHPGLNGSYYIGETWFTGNETETSGTDGSTPPTADKTSEQLQNYLLQSQVDNPFTFNTSGYVRVGQGTIIGMAGLTTALSQDAYLVSTTLVFTTQGIWAVKIDDEGQYSSVAPPFSREVCNNPDSITMVDHAVYFTSEKGLMITDGNDVQCVSDQMYNDAEFHEFLAGCQIAFDYRDRLLWITNEEYDYHYIYNMASQTFAKLIDDNKYTAIVGDYPDVLMQDSTKVVHSLINKPFAGKDPKTYSGEVQTRPMKFDDPFALKNISQIEPVSLINSKEGVEKGSKITMYASNNLRDWYEITSIKGAPFKYFKMKYTFTNLNADDVYSGTEVVFATRRTNKLR